MVKANQSNRTFSGINLYHRRAGFWRRLLAILFDCCLIWLIILFFFLGSVMAVQIGLGYISEFSWPPVLRLISSLIISFQFIELIIIITYFTFFHGYTGQTPGKQLFGLRVIHTSGLPLTYGQAFLRWVGYILSALPMNLGFLWAALDRNKQGWHDKLTDTYVVYTR